jgi:hypothetical protein
MTGSKMPMTLQHIKGCDLPQVLAHPLKVSPEKTYTMTVEIAEEPSTSTTKVSQQVVDPAFDFLNDIENIAVDAGATDLSYQHDHYLHGLPKKA